MLWFAALKRCSLFVQERPLQGNGTGSRFLYVNRCPARKKRAGGRNVGWEVSAVIDAMNGSHPNNQLALSIDAP